MGVKTVQVTQNVNQNGWPATEWTDSTREQREVTVDGQTFHYGMNERKNFLDEGVGAKAAAFNTATPTAEVEDTNNMAGSRF